MVATKFGHQFHPEAMGQADRSPVQLRTDHWTPTEVVGQLESSDAPTGPVVISDNQRGVLRRARLSGLLHEYHRQAA